MKTLKDILKEWMAIEFENNEVVDESNHEVRFIWEVIRGEAIKQVKKLRKKKDNIIHLVPLNVQEYMKDLKKINELIGKIDWIKKFFNIREKDLK